MKHLNTFESFTTYKEDIENNINTEKNDSVEKEIVKYELCGNICNLICNNKIMAEIKGDEDIAIDICKMINFFLSDKEHNVFNISNDTQKEFIIVDIYDPYGEKILDQLKIRFEDFYLN